MTGGAAAGLTAAANPNPDPPRAPTSLADYTRRFTRTHIHAKNWVIFNCKGSPPPLLLIDEETNLEIWSAVAHLAGEFSPWEMALVAHCGT
jgi:hypothetical protein